MTSLTKMAALLPLLLLLIPAIASSKEDSEKELVVRAKKEVSGPTTLSGAGFKTDDIEIGPLGYKSRMDTPYSSTTVSREMVKNEQLKSVSELLKYSPSTQMQARGGMDVGRPQSRGMQGNVVSNSRLDGLNIVATTAFPVEMLERLDVLNSLTGALYGPASPAGQFNFVAKRPTQQTLRDVTVGYQSRRAFNLALDLGGHIDDNDVFGYRINALDEDGEGNVQGSTLRRRLMSVALDWNLRPGTQLQLNASHYEFQQKGYPGSFSYGPSIQLPSAPNQKNKNLALDTAGNDLTTDTLSSRLIHYFNSDWYTTLGVGWQQADRAMRSVTSTLLNNAGDIKRSMKNSTAAGRFRVLSNTATLNGHLTTGPVDHDVALSTTGYIWTLYSSKNAGQNYNLGNTNMYHPGEMIEPADGKIYKHGPRYKSGRTLQQSITLGDTLTFNPQWSAMFYLSESWLQTRNFNNKAQKTSEKNQNGLSPNAALMYKITPSLMAYISYADSLEQGSTAPLDMGIKNEGQTLNPYRSRQYEIGLKANAGGIDLGAALFRLKRPFAFVDPADMLYKEQGNQVNNGLELTAAGEVFSGFSVFGGVTFLDPQLKDTVSAETSNKWGVGVPRVQANILMEYSLPSMPQWVYTANVHYTGKRAANDTNSSWAGSYTTLDLGTRYTTRIQNVSTTFRVALNNVTNEHYWASIFPSGTDGTGGSASAFLGNGREVRASVSFSF